jgi:hypothetical protein
MALSYGEYACVSGNQKKNKKEYIKEKENKK